jgi:hypothetical protein
MTAHRGKFAAFPVADSCSEQGTERAAVRVTRGLKKARKTLNVFSCSLAGLVGLFGISIALMTLRRGVWTDVFITIAWTTPDTSLREFLHLMVTRDLHPVLHYGAVYLLQTAGVTDIALLRSTHPLPHSLRSAFLTASSPDWTVVTSVMASWITCARHRARGFRV